MMIQNDGKIPRRRASTLLALLLVVLAVVAVATSASPAASATAGWTGQFSGTTQQLTAVSFVDLTHGWAVGVGGTIVATGDGGQNWHAQSSGTTAALAGVSFVDANHGWAVGYEGGGSGTIVATSDGGATWSTEPVAAADPLYAVSFVDQTHGWAVGGGGEIFATSDSGQSWQGQTSGTSEILFGVSFVDQNHGVAVGDHGSILATNDGGATWVAEKSGTSESLLSVSFVDQNHGWAGSNLGTIVATGDEGATWTAQLHAGITHSFSGVSFVDQSHGWAVGSGGGIFATSDGGQSWQAQTSGTSNYLFGVSFVDQNHGWAVGAGGTIRVYVAPPPTVGLSPGSVAFGDQLVGSTSPAQTITVTNSAGSGSQSLAIGQLSIGGANAADFALVNDTCSNTTVAAGSSCTVGAKFTPTAAGSRGASVSIPSNAASSPDQVALSGNGTASADVSLGVTGPNTAPSGSQDTYTFTIANAGPSTASSVVLTAQVPNGTKFVGVTTTQGSCTHPASGSTSGTITCTLGDLAQGASALNNVTLKITLSSKGGSVVVAAKASSPTSDPNLGNNVASVTTTVPKK